MRSEVHWRAWGLRNEDGRLRIEEQNRGRSSLDATGRFRLVDRVNHASADSDFLDAVKIGLTSDRKSLPCRFFYDEVGSRLFEEICSLPEYYLTRSEREILTTYASRIVEGLPEDTTVVELGSGSATKTRLLIEALLAERATLRFTPIDISASALESSSVSLLEAFPQLAILAVAAEYQDGIAALKEENSGPELILWLGSSIGNLTRPAATQFLHSLRTEMSSEDRFLIGIDLRKSAAVLEPAYDDAAGVTARFNKNVLIRVNEELDGHFDLASFEHLARYDEAEGRVEMHLVSQIDQTVVIDDLKLDVAFAEGETIHTENSYKYSLDEIGDLATTSGLMIEGQWFDGERRFSLNLLAPKPA